MQIAINDNDKEEKNVIYKITLSTANQDDKYYIGMTTRPLKKRLQEHLYNKKSSVKKYLLENQVDKVEMSIIRRCRYSQTLVNQEMKAMVNHILEKGKRKHNLINLDKRGLDKMTLKQIKELNKYL